MNQTMAPPPGVVILGATSGIARAVAQCFARNGWRLVLAARDTEELDRLAADLRVRWQADCATLPLEATAFETHGAFVEACAAHLGDGLEGIVLCLGTMPPQAEAEQNFATARNVIDTNYTAAVSLLERFTALLAPRRRGWICGVVSVAGDRGRQSNYLYGSAKAAVAAYLEGLRNRLWHHGVHVITVKPGPVDTAMTFGLDKLPLLAQPDAVGQQIYRAILKRRNVVYTPWPWRWIMLLIRQVPEWKFKTMKM